MKKVNEVAFWTLFAIAIGMMVVSLFFIGTAVPIILWSIAIVCIAAMIPLIVATPELW